MQGLSRDGGQCAEVTLRLSQLVLQAQAIPIVLTDGGRDVGQIAGPVLPPNKEGVETRVADSEHTPKTMSLFSHPL